MRNSGLDIEFCENAGLHKDAIINPIERQAYTGSVVTPRPVVTIYGTKLTEGSDYTLSYRNNVNKGTATVTITGKGRVNGTKTLNFSIVDEFEMYRLYNPNSGEHFYTASESERDPVYRLYNANGGEHHYTTSAAERDMLVAAGWKYEGIAWMSDPARGVALLREYNPNAFSCNHNYTTSRAEHDWLVSLGWRDEGVGWYGVASAT
ncbi:MAG: hypothetical protein Q4C09_07710 [Atopobiaceae bacterium]|nr:hypothetical protein [Atopobiaceae bacterium]